MLTAACCAEQVNITMVRNLMSSATVCSEEGRPGWAPPKFALKSICQVPRSAKSMNQIPAEKQRDEGWLNLAFSSPVLLEEKDFSSQFCLLQLLCLLQPQPGVTQDLGGFFEISLPHKKMHFPNSTTMSKTAPDTRRMPQGHQSKKEKNIRSFLESRKTSEA